VINVNDNYSIAPFAGSFIDKILEKGSKKEVNHTMKIAV